MEAFHSVEHKYYVEFFANYLIELLLWENFYISTVTNIKTIAGGTLAMYFFNKKNSLLLLICWCKLKWTIG